MRRPILAVVLVALTCLAGALPAQEKLTSSTLPDFLARNDTNFPLLGSVYTELANEQLPLRDEQGQPLGRRPIEDRREALSDLRQTAREFAADPQNLTLAVRVVIQTELLADDLFDLSQLAYDNDREELGKRLSDLQITMDHNKDLLAAYLLSLAGETQDRLRQLEKENQELQNKLKEAAEPPKARSDRR